MLLFLVSLLYLHHLALLSVQVKPAMVSGSLKQLCSMLAAGDSSTVVVIANVLQVPFKLFVVCGLVEWLMLCGIIHGVKQTYPTAAAGITAHSSSFLYLLSFLLVYLVPLVITAAVEYRQKQQYSECTVRPVAAAGEQQQPQQQRVQQGGRSQSQLSCSAYTQDEHRAAFTERTTTDATTTSSCCVDSHADTSPGTTAAAAEAPTVSQDSSTGSLSSPAGHTPSAHCLSEPAIADLLPRLRLLLGEATLQDLINDLQNNTTSATAAGPPVHYQGLCTVTNASIKVRYWAVCEVLLIHR